MKHKYVPFSLGKQTYGECAKAPWLDEFAHTVSDCSGSSTGLQDLSGFGHIDRVLRVRTVVRYNRILDIGFTKHMDSSSYAIPLSTFSFCMPLGSSKSAPSHGANSEAAAAASFEKVYTSFFVSAGKKCISFWVHGSLQLNNPSPNVRTTRPQNAH